MDFDFRERSRPLYDKVDGETGQVGETCVFSAENSSIYFDLEKTREYGAQGPDIRLTWPTARDFRSYLGMLVHELGHDSSTEVMFFYMNGENYHENTAVLEDLLSSREARADGENIPLSSVCGSMMENGEEAVQWTENGECSPEMTVYPSSLDAGTLAHYVSLDRPDVENGEVEVAVEELIEKASNHEFEWVYEFDSV